MRVVVTLIVMGLCSNAVFAQTSPGTAPSTPTAAATTPANSRAVAARNMKPRTANSIKCAQEADARGLHGKARKSFRATCKKQAKRGMLSRWLSWRPSSTWKTKKEK